MTRSGATLPAGMWLLAVLLLACQPVVWTAENFRVLLSPLSPCLAVLANVFLVSSLGVAAYIRFAIWFVVAMAIYILYGVHHTRDETLDAAVSYASMPDQARGALELTSKGAAMAPNNGLGSDTVLFHEQNGGAMTKAVSRGSSRVASPRGREHTPRNGSSGAADAGGAAGTPELDES